MLTVISRNKRMKAVFISFILAALLISACDLLNSPKDLDSEKRVVSNQVEFILEVPENNFFLKDSLRFSFIVKNRSSQKKDFSFANIQQIGFNLSQGERVALFYPWAVAPALSYFSLEPGEEKKFNVSKNFKDHTGKYIKRGSYKLKAYLLDKNSPILEVPISVF